MVRSAQNRPGAVRRRGGPRVLSGTITHAALLGFRRHERVRDCRIRRCRRNFRVRSTPARHTLSVRSFRVWKWTHVGLWHAAYALLLPNAMHFGERTTATLIRRPYRARHNFRLQFGRACWSGRTVAGRPATLPPSRICSRYDSNTREGTPDVLPSMLG
jgi:hypothetical protein